MARKSWLEKLLRRVSNSSAPASRKRPGVRLTALEILEDRLAPATLNWTGATSANWNVAGNWTPNAVPAAGDTLNFNSATAGLVSFNSNNDIAGLTGLTISVVDADSAAGRNFTLTGLGIGIASLTNNKTDAATPATATSVALPLTGAGATITATAGEISISNSANVFDAASTLNVPTGAIADINVKPSGSLGNAKLNVTGGTLNLTGPAPVDTPNVLMQQWFNTSSVARDENFINNMGNGSNGGLLSFSPNVGSKLLTTALTYANAAAFNASTASPVTGVAGTATDNFAYLWTGSFTAVKAGSYTFGVGQTSAGVDDEMSILIDFNNNGIFENATERVASTIGVACCGNGTSAAARTYTAGEKHLMAIGFHEFTGGELGSATFSIAGDANFGTLTSINPGAALQAGMWSSTNKPANNVGAITNNVSVSGTSTITMANFLDGATLGNLTMASGATLTLTPTAAQTLTFGTTSLGGNATFSTAANATLNLSGIVSETAASSLTKTGVGTLNLPAVNTYSGVTNINAGVVNAFNGSFGTATGAADGTIVAAGAQVFLKANYTTAENLSLNGTGTTATSGALATDTSFSFAGPITLQSNTWIAASANTLTLSGGINIGANQLTLAGAGTVTVATAGITGSGRLVHTEAGTGRLNVANPNFTGDINVAAGTLRASVDGSLGTVAGATNVSSGATLRFDGPLTYATLEPLNIAGGGLSNVGAINISGGNVTLAAPITLVGSATIGSETAGNKLTLNSKITMPLVANLSFTGAGDIDVTQAFGNGTAGVQSNAALSSGYTYDTTGNRTTDMDNVGAGAGHGGTPSPTWFGTTAGTSFVGTALLKGALNVSDNNSPATPATVNGSSGFAGLFGSASLDITNFLVLWTGQMNVTTAGTYKFGTGNVGGLVGTAPNTEGRVYVDINQDHLFQTTPATGLSEKLLIANADGQTTTTGVLLQPGTYDIAIPFTNGGGSGGISFAFSSNNGTTYQFIDPSAGTVAGTSFTNPTTFALTPSNNVIKNGAGTVTLLGNNTYNGTTTVNAGALVAGNVGALGAGPAGTAVKSGGTLGLVGGVAITTEALTLNGVGASGQPGALASISGANSFTGVITAETTSAGTFGIGSTAGALTLNGSVDQKYSKVVFNGAGDIVVNSIIGGAGATQVSTGISETIFNGSSGDPQTNIEEFRNRALGAGDSKGTLATQITYSDNSTAGTVDITSRAAALGAAGFDAGDWSGLWVTTFTPNEAGVWQFQGFGIDDNVGFWIDTDQNGAFESTANRFGNRACCGDTGVYSTPALVSGQKYLLGIALTDTGGGGIISNVQFKSPTAAGITAGVFASLNPTLFPNTFQSTLVADNSLVKSGAGALTLSGANTYNGNTTITGGTVNYTVANAFGTSPTSTLTVSGASTVVNLFNGATAVTTVGKADFSLGTGTVNTGVLGGKLAIKSQLKLAGGYTATGDMTAQGANLVDNTVARTLSAATGTVNVARVAPAVIASPDNGQMFVNGTTQSNTFTYTASANATVLIVSIDTRSGTQNLGLSAITYAGVPLIPAVISQATAGTYHNSFIYYLYGPKTGVASPLVVNFSAAIDSAFVVYAQTLSGVDVTSIPAAGAVANTELVNSPQTVTVNGIVAGSWAVSNFNYRTGTGPLTTSSTNGTALIGGTINPAGTTGLTGDFWYASLTNVIGIGGLFSNLSAGSATFTNSAAAASGGHWNGVAAAFAPNFVPAAVNLPATNFTVAAGANLTFNGTGTDTIGSLTLGGASATVSPGAAGAGLVNTGNLAAASGSILKFDINGATVGTQYDQVNVTGTVNLNSDTGAGAILNLAGTFAPAVGNTFTIINNDSADPVSGTFAGLAQGATVASNQGKFTISYTGGDGNDVVLTAVAPATLNWTGAVSTNWSVAGNWSPSQVPSGGDNLIFSSATTGLVSFASNNDIAGLIGLKISIVDANSTAGKDFTLTGLGIGLASLTNNKTDTVTPATATSVTMPLTGVGAAINVTAGELSILTTTNAFDAASSLNVPTGAIADIAISPSSSLGTAKINLTGGVLNVTSAGQTFTNALNVGQNATAAGSDFVVASVPNPALGTDVQTFPMMPDISRNVPGTDTTFPTNTHTWGNNNTYFYSGEIFFPDSNGNGTGTLSFAEQSDDGTFLRIDGVVYLNDNTWDNTNVATTPTTGGAITLPTGWHALDLRFGNGGGGAGVSGQNPGANTANVGALNWALGNGSTTAPTGKGFGYRVDSGPGTTDPRWNSKNANDYRRLYATPTPYAITAATQTAGSGTTTITTSAPHGIFVGDSVTIAGMTPTGYNGTFTVTAINTTGTTFTFTNPVTGLGAGTAFGTVLGPDTGVRLRIPNPAVGVVTNAVSASGASTINVGSTLVSASMGALTTASGSTLAVNVATAGQFLAFATTSLGGNSTFNTGANAVLRLTGAVSETAASGITKTGTGTLTLNSANTYSGATSINAGVVTTNASGALGTATGAADGTTVASGAQLFLKSSNTTAENLFLNGTGISNGGALTSDGNFTWSGPVTLQSNSSIVPSANTLTLSGGINTGTFQLTFGGSGTTTVATTAISGTGSIVKAGSGVLNLNIANTYTGTTSITSGTVRVSTNNALGTIAGGTDVSNGATLEFVGPFNYTTLEAFNLVGAGVGGVGAINITGGNVTLSSPISITSATIGSGVAGNKLTLSSAINMPSVGNLTLTGPGNIDVAQAFGNGAPASTLVNGIKETFFNASTGNPATDIESFRTRALLAADATGVLTTQISYSDNAAAGTADVTARAVGLGAVGFDAGDWTGLWVTTFTPNEAGVWSFRGFGIDDVVGFWIDTDQNGIFETANRFGARGNANGNPTACCGDTGTYTTPALVAGQKYLLGIVLTDTGGGGIINDVEFRSPSATTANGPFVNLDPSLTANNGLFQTQSVVNNNVIKNGAGVTTLLGANTYSGTTTINAGTLVPAVATALPSTTNVLVNLGGTLGVQGGISLPTPITLNGAGAGGVGAINNITGTNTLTGPVTIGSSATIGSTAGALNLNGTMTLGKVANLTFIGAGNTTVAQSFGNGNVATTTANSLLAQWYNTSAVAQDESFLTAMGASSNGGLFTLPAVGSKFLTGALNFANAAAFNASTTTPTTGVAGTLTDTFGFMWTGTFKAVKAGTYTFGLGQASSNTVDDEMVFLIDLNDDGVFSNATERVTDTIGVGCCAVGATRITPTFAAGESHRIAIAFQEMGGGEAGSATFSIAGDATFGTLTAINPGAANQAGMWSFVDQPVNNVIVSGTGTVTFGAANTYNGNTTVTSGTLATTANNALGSNPASTLKVSGATTAVNLFNNASAVTTVGSADLGAGTGTLNAGVLGGKLAIKSQLSLSGGYTVTGDMTAQGANLVNNSTPRTLTAVTGTLGVAAIGPGAITMPNVGQLFPGATAQNNTFTYTAAAGSQVLVVSVDTRSATATHAVGTITYGGTPLKLAVSSMATASSYHSSFIYYLVGPTTGAALPLVVNFTDADVTTGFAVHAFTLSGVDAAVAPMFAKPTTTETANLTQSVTVTGVPAGSWAVSTFNYRIGNTGLITEANTNGTAITGGQSIITTAAAVPTTAASKNLWYRQDADSIFLGGVFSNLSAGDVTISATALGAAGTSHFNGAAAVFKPANVAAAINLPATSISLAAGTTLSLNGAGATVLGDLTLAGNGTVAAGASIPTSLTVGSVGGAGTGTFAINNNLGLKLATGSTFKVDLNGTTAGTQYDQANVTGAVDLNGATLAVTLGATPAGGNSFTIISNDGTDAIVGTFAGLAQGATLTVGTSKFTISYTGGDGNDVVLAAPAATSASLNWTGAVSSNWNVAGNWLENRVPVSNDNLIFSSATTGLVSYTANNDITGLTGLSINIVDANSAAGKDFALTGLGIGLASLTNNKTDTPATATSVALPLTGAGASITAIAGTLAINGALTGSAFTLVSSGATLAGVGSAGSVVALSGGSVAPGTAAGKLTTGNLALFTGSNFNVDLNGATAGTLYDQADVTGAVNLKTDGGTGAKLNVALGFSPAVGGAFTIINNDGTDPVVGTFNGFAEGAAVTAGSATFKISYTGGDGNDVVLTAQAVTPIATTTTLVATPLATTGGSSVQFTATVAPSPGVTGTVTFLDGASAITGGSNIPLVNGVATFSTTTLTVGTHPITAVYSGSTGYLTSTSDPQNVVITGTGLQVVSVVPNANIPALAGDQRSRIASLVLTFNGPVSMDLGAVTIALHTNGVSYAGVAQPTGYGTLPASLALSTADNTIWSVGFVGNTDDGLDGYNSIKDGVYDLKVDAAKVHPFGKPGTNMVANATTTFDRLFGDINLPTTPPGGVPGVDFEAIVSSGDNLVFRSAFNNDAEYKASLDFNGDLSVNSGENFQFRTRFNKSLRWKA